MKFVKCYLLLFQKISTDRANCGDLEVRFEFLFVTPCFTCHVEVNGSLSTVFCRLVSYYRQISQRQIKHFPWTLVGGGDASPSPGQNVYNFLWFSGKIGQIVGRRLPWVLESPSLSNPGSATDGSTLCLNFAFYFTDLFLEETVEAFVCEHKVLNITCPADKRIEILSANYGRTVSCYESLLSAFRRNGEGDVFTRVCLSVHTQGGTPSSADGGGGYPHPPDEGGRSTPSGQQGVPQFSWWRFPCLANWGGYPIWPMREGTLISGSGYPLQK